MSIARTHPLPPAGVVHWVVEATDDVLDFLGPVTRVLAQLGVAQVVVALEEVQRQRIAPVCEHSVALVLVPRSRNPLLNWVHSLHAMRHVVGRVDVEAIHLHGLLPRLGARWVLPAGGKQPVLLYSPHASLPLRLLRRTAARVMRRAGNSASAMPRQQVLARLLWEERTLRELAREPIGPMETPVPPAFFAVSSNEARYPLGITSSRTADARGAGSISQLAVLFGDRNIRMGFNWLGVQDDESKRRLAAAGVQVYEAAGDEERAMRLAAAWFYLSTGWRRESPVCLLEAMAVGLPCIVLDTPDHRELIRHGRNGLLYRDVDQLLSYIAHLVDCKALRMQLGDAARAEAASRFGDQRFRRALMSAYALVAPAGPPMAVAAERSAP